MTLYSLTVCYSRVLYRHSVVNHPPCSRPRLPSAALAYQLAVRELMVRIGMARGKEGKRERERERESTEIERERKRQQN